MSVIDEQLLSILACPACKVEVRLEDDRLVCVECKRRYPIRDGIPVMLIEEAEAPAEQESDEGGTQSGETEESAPQAD